MCLSNADEVTLYWNGWVDLFPKGIPDIYTNGELSINPRLLHGKKGKERKSMLEELIKNAQNALMDDWYQKTKHWQLLIATKEKTNENT